MSSPFSHLKAGLVVTFLVAMLIACGTRTAENSAAQIDAYLSQLTREQRFSGSALVARQGEILLSKGYGMGDMENRVPNTPQTRFRIHWITMQFTATAVLMLQAAGKLNVQDSICQYIPDCPDYWQGISLHHLLTHTSGLSDWVQPWESAAERPTSSLELVDHLKHEPPYFEPGEGFRYSENGYVVLGYIIEKVSDQRYDIFLQQRIFEPLGMANSGYGNEEVAVGYNPIGTKAPDPDLLFRYSASGLYASVEDLYRWDQALYSTQLLPQEYMDRMLSGYVRTPSVDIEEADYGYGWFIGKVLNRRVIAHGGSMAGYTAMFLRFPDDRATIVVLRNYGLDVYDHLEIELAKMVFGE